MSSITVIDYGAGNLLNVVRALEHSGASVTVTQDPAAIGHAKKLVFPGVGAFGDCMKALHRLELADPIRRYIASGKSFLGICVGMQVMFDVGEEFGEHEGLGIIPGRVRRIASVNAEGRAHKIPHIGWENLECPPAQQWQHTPLEPLLDHPDPSVYFVHSYAGEPARPEHCLATVQYNGLALCAAVRFGYAYGVQFHPEKSGKTGLLILKKFIDLPGGDTSAG